MVNLRFAPSPTGSLHLGNALSAVANRRFADERQGRLLLRIDDTDPARNVEGGFEAIVADPEPLATGDDRREAALDVPRRIRVVEGGFEAIVADLEWLGIGWDEGPLRQ